MLNYPTLKEPYINFSSEYHTCRYSYIEILSVSFLFDFRRNNNNTPIIVTARHPSPPITIPIIGPNPIAVESSSESFTILSGSDSVVVVLTSTELLVVVVMATAPVVVPVVKWPVVEWPVVVAMIMKPVVDGIIKSSRSMRS